MAMGVEQVELGGGTVPADGGSTGVGGGGAVVARGDMTIPKRTIGVQ
jgi:hypothetical protein